MIPTKKFLILDTETTGVDKKLNDPVQIAGIFRCEGSPNNGLEFNITSRPINENTISSDALKVTGLTKEKIMNYQPAVYAYKEFTSIVKKFVNPYDRNDKIFIIGYNSRFDTDMLREWFAKLGDKYYGSLFYPYTKDLYQTATDMFMLGMLDGIQNLKLETVYQFIFKEEFDAHDAMADVKATLRLYEHFRTLNFACPELP